MLRRFGGRWVGWLGVWAVMVSALASGQDPASDKGTPAAASNEPAVYEVVLLSLKADWQAMRINGQTGESWYAFQGNWKPVPEADNAKPPAGDYRVQMSQTGDNDWIAIRLERKSGRTWRLAALKWVEMKVLEPEKPKEDASLKL